MRKLRAAILILLFLGAGTFLHGAVLQSGWTIESKEGATFDFDTGVAIATNGVVVKYGDSVLTAQRATVNQITGEVQAEGGVRIERLGQLWMGETIQFNFKTKKMAGQDFRSGQLPYFLQGEVFVADQAADVYVAANTRITTDDYAQPGYTIRAKTIVIVPGEYILCRHAMLYLRNTPVFYFPLYRRSLKSHPNYWVLTPGYRSRDGAFLLSSYNYYWNERFDGALHLDARQKRGFGVGPDFNYHLPRFGEGAFKYYYLSDDQPGLDPVGAPINDDRKRLLFTHQTALTSNLTAKLVARYQSDAQIVRDFFEDEYQRNVQPNSYFEANQNWRNFSLNVLAQPRVNRFYETVERLPDVKLTGWRQQIGETPLYYESDSSVGYFRRKFSNDFTNQYAALRADTYQQVTLPWTFFEWLNLTPRVGGRLTHYGETEGRTATTTEQNRGVFNTGAEVSMKASRVWPGVSSRVFDVDGLRHIAQPSVNYVWVPRPGRRPALLPQFDSELPTRRLPPIEFPDYNAIDSIDSQNVLRFTLRNLLQTKRKNGVEDFVNWALYTDWRLRPRPGQGTFADVYSDLELRPASWLTLYSETRLDVARREWAEANHSISITRSANWRWRVGHRYLRDEPALGPDSGNNLVYSTAYYRVNENWAARVSQHFEARDGTMEEQYYTVYRDFRSWTAALTLRLRDQRTGPTDFTIALTFSLKAFPRFGLGEDDINTPRLSGY